MKKLVFIILVLSTTARVPKAQADIKVMGDGEQLIWFNNSQTFSINASSSMSESVNYIWPVADATSGGQALLSDGSGLMSWGTPTTSAAHNILSGTHDATTNAVTRGSIIYGNSTPKWDELVIGAANTFLKSDGTDAAWSTLTVSSPVTLTGATIGWDSTLIDATTWSDGSNASNIWMFDVSGTDHTMTAGNGLMTFSNDVTAAGLTITNATVIGSDSVVFQPNTDSTTFLQVLDADGGTPIFNVDSTNEKVGIYTTTPKNSLHIFGSEAIDIFAGIGTDPSIATGCALNFGMANATDGKASGFFNVRRAADNTLPTLLFQTNGVDRIFIETNGDIGIGNTSPSVKLDVSGDITGVSGILTDLTLSDLTQFSVVFVGSNGAITEDNSNLFWQSSTKNFGIRTGDPKNSLHVFGNESVDIFAGIGNDPSSSTGCALNFGMANASFGKASGFFNVRRAADNTLPTLRFLLNEVNRFHITDVGFVGFSEDAPETAHEITNTVPYLTLHNSTHEDSDGGRESRLNFKGEQSGGEETTLARIEVGHDGAADDEKGYIDIFRNTGSDGDSPTKLIRIDSDGLKIGDGGVTNYAQFATDDGELTLVGTARVLRSVDFEPSALKKGGVGPADSTEDSFPIHDYDSTNDESVFVHWEIPHDYSSAGEIHLHAEYFVDTAPGAAANVTWGVEYKKQSIGDNFDFGAGTTTVIVNDAITTGTPANDKQIHNSDQIQLTTTGFEPMDVVLIRFFRDADASEAGATDDFGSDVRVFNYHLMYLSDKLGEAS